MFAMLDLFVMVELSDQNLLISLQELYALQVAFACKAVLLRANVLQDGLVFSRALMIILLVLSVKLDTIAKDQEVAQTLHKFVQLVHYVPKDLLTTLLLHLLNQVTILRLVKLLQYNVPSDNTKTKPDNLVV